MGESDVTRAAMDALASELEEATAQAVVVVDAEDRVVRWSLVAERMFGASAERARGARAAELLPLPPRDEGTPPVIELLARGERWGAAPDRASSREPLVWTARPFHDAGRFVGAIYCARRVGPAHASAESAARGREIAARAFDVALESMVVLDRQRRVLAANAAYQVAIESAHGRKVDLGEDLLAFAAPGTEGPFLTSVARAFAGEHLRRARAITYPNGQEFDAMFEYTPLAEHGETDAVLFGQVKVDSVRASSKLLDLVSRGLASSAFVLVVCDAQAPDMPIVYVSRSVEKVTGYTPEELVGKNPRLFQGRFRSQPALDVVRHAMATGQPCDVVLRNERKDGTAFWNRLSLTPIRDELGAVSHFVAIQEDVTERELLLERLRAAQAGETSRQMLGGVVHDLRNMLTVVSAQVQLALEDAKRGTNQSESLREALEAVHQAAALTRLLLTPVSRTRSMQGSASVAEVLRTVEAVSRYVAPSTIGIAVDLGPGADATVVGDRGALEQVFLNLVLNATEAMPSGGHVAVRVSRGVPAEAATPAEQRASAEHWTISVEDDGAGMSEDVLAHLFEPYFTTKGRGTGLGLATCARLVQAAGGRIRVRSKLGTGTRFHVTLPPGTPLAQHETRRARSGRTVAGLEALVVEPDTSVRAAISTMLRRRGGIVRDAGDAAVARELASTMGRSALLVVDAERLAGAEELLASWVSAEARRALVLGGPDETPVTRHPRVARLPKPFDFDALLLAIADLFDTRSSVEASPQV